MEGFAVTACRVEAIGEGGCPLAPRVPHRVSGSCSSPRAFALGFLPTPSHDDAVALSLPFGFSFHLAWGLAPHTLRAMPGTHDEAVGSAR